MDVISMTDSALLNALGAPAATSYNHIMNEYNPRPTLWATDWDTFDEYLKVRQTDTNTSISTNIINTVLSVQTTPVPSNVITTLLGNNHNSSSAVSTSASDSTSTSASAAVLQYQSFLIAAQNNQTSKEVFLQLIQHATSIQKTNFNFINVSSLTKLLHTSVKLNNIGTATAIIEYCPQSLGHTDIMGFLSIQVAFSYQNSSSTSSSEGKRRSDIVRLLIHEGMKHDIGGIHGCGGIFVERSKACSGGNAFYLALYYLRRGYARARERRNNRNPTHDHTHDPTSHDHTHDFDDDDCDDEWECLRLCYEAAKSTITDFQLINYIITLEVGMEQMLGDIVKKYNINLHDTDMNGMTPLVVAIHKKQTSYIKTLLSIQGNCASEAIQLCTIDGKEYTNCFPLHIAVNQGITWDKGLKEIVECNKMALGLVDTTNNLFPFMVATQWGENPLTDVYSLLRNQPEVVENFIVNNNPQFVVRRKTQRNVISGEYTIHVILGIMLSAILYFVKETLTK